MLVTSPWLSMGLSWFCGHSFGWNTLSIQWLILFLVSNGCDFTKQRKCRLWLLRQVIQIQLYEWSRRNHRGVTLINDAEEHIITKKKAVLWRLLRVKSTDFKHYMRKADPKAFVSLQKMLHIQVVLLIWWLTKRKLTNVSFFLLRIFVDEMLADFTISVW